MLPKRRNSALLEPGDHPEHPLLLRDPEPGLEADQVPHLPGAVLPAELHHRVRLAAGARIGQAHRLHRAEAQRLAPAARHLLDRQAALEVRHLVELVAVVLVGRDQRVEERSYCLARPSGALR